MQRPLPPPAPPAIIADSLKQSVTPVGKSAFTNDFQMRQMEARILAIQTQLRPMYDKRDALRNVINAKLKAGTDAGTERAAYKDLDTRITPLDKELSQLFAKRNERIAVLQLQQLK